MEYWKTTTIPSYLCDIDDRLHPWAAVRMFQEVSEHHTNDLHIGFADLMRSGRAWVLSRAYYEFHARPEAFQEVRIGTWSRGNNGLFAFRDYEMLATDGQLLIAGTSYWPIIDMNTRSVVRLHDLLAQFPVDSREATAHSRLDRLLTFDTQALLPELELDVHYSMLDHTRHVNNAEYNKWVFDVLSKHGADYGQPFSIELNYQSETRPTEHCQVFCQLTDRPQQTSDPKPAQQSYNLQIRNTRGLSVAARVAAHTK